MDEKKLNNRDKFIQLGITLASIRKIRDMTQEQLAEKAGISRTFLSAIEAPGTVRAFSLDVLFSISDALGVRAGDLLNFAEYPDEILNKQNTDRESQNSVLQ